MPIGNNNIQSQPQKNDRGVECPYKDCQLPEKNTRYIIQIFFLLLSVFIMTNNYTSFTSFTIFMFVAPLFIDAWYFTPNGKFLKVMRNLLVAITFSILFLFFLCDRNVIVESLETFSVNKNNILIGSFCNWVIKKYYVSIVLLFLGCSPIMYYIGSPIKQAKVLSHITELFKSA